MYSFLIFAFLYVAFMGFAAKRLMTYLHILQQDDYDNERLVKWILQYRVFDKRLSLGLLVLGALVFLLGDLALVLMAIAFIIVAVLEKDPRKASKKKLVLTKRAQRIFGIAIILNLIVAPAYFYIPFPWIAIVGVQFVPFTLVLANVLLMPFESYTQKKFWDEAHAKLNALKPTVIGITGSFGKTSVKHILGHILKTHAPTLITPGSVNTPMGVTRILREQLEDNHKYFIAEMGAYGPGSVARLCRLAPPDFGIITAIGHAHYERFKTLDTVAEAKFELAEAVIRKNGKVIIHDTTLKFAHAEKIRGANTGNFVVCGMGSDTNDLYIQKMQQADSGIVVEVNIHGHIYTLEAPLYGLHHGHNIALAFATALQLGIPAEHILTALRSVPQITHRLEVKRQADGTTIIDDAFNSNPKGFRSALELLGLLGRDGRKILITPGMVEMGAAHEEEHKAIGEYAGEVCDILIAVNPGRILPLIDGFIRTGKGKQVLQVANFAEAAKWLDANRRSGDVILLENDLPDLYERIPKI
jgi:UDP-N-acetylmuramoyl-tripeptide--D-alanyl-D-alanine ligase